VEHIPEVVHGLHHDGGAVEHDDVFGAHGDYEGEDHGSHSDRFEKCKIIDSKPELSSMANNYTRRCGR